MNIKQLESNYGFKIASKLRKNILFKRNDAIIQCKSRHAMIGYTVNARDLQNRVF